jgi:hypothetical protein
MLLFKSLRRAVLPQSTKEPGNIFSLKEIVLIYTFKLYHNPKCLFVYQTHISSYLCLKSYHEQLYKKAGIEC